MFAPWLKTLEEYPIWIHTPEVKAGIQMDY